MCRRQRKGSRPDTLRFVPDWSASGLRRHGHQAKSTIRTGRDGDGRMFVLLPLEAVIRILHRAETAELRWVFMKLKGQC